MISAQPNVVLVSMPWTNVVQPALGLAILRAELDRSKIPCRVYHANLDLLASVSVPTYDLVADLVGLNEFVFTAVLQPELDRKQLDAVKSQCETFAGRKCNPQYPTPRDLARLFLGLRESVIPAYLARCADKILAMRPSLVGFTCMFDQTLASAALAKLLKDVAPELTIAFGGYAVQHDNGVEVLRTFPWIDCIARGDGEPLIEKLAAASVGCGRLDEIGGLLTRPMLGNGGETPAPRWNLTNSTTPNFDDWFDDLANLDREHRVLIKSPFLLIESSRGCWWGQKHHCTFCGIDDFTLKYRSKSADQVFDEISALRARYGTTIGMRFADYIWPYDFYKDLLPRLAALDPPVALEAEIKANQRPETLQAFSRAGFVALQPGIESFSSSVLRKMDKGVTAIQNVQLLKWGYLNGIEIQYNILVGFPDDEVAEYLEQAERIPRLYHLTPPTNFSLVAVTRFAPLHATPGRFGHNGPVRRHQLYDVLFSTEFLETTGLDLDQYCYNFDRYFENGAELNENYYRLKLQSEFWKEQHRSREVYLSATRDGEGYLFEDTRFGEAKRFRIDGPAAGVYAHCEGAAVGIEQLEARFGRETARGAVADLDDLRVVWIGDGQIFGLGVAAEVVSSHIARGFKWRWSAIASR